MSYVVGEVARVAGVSVRTLHHYDDIGLLRPSGRTPAGYRQYTPSDLEALQRILCYRALGFRLADIARLLQEGPADTLVQLRQQHRLLTERIARLQRVLTTVEKAVEARQMGINLDPHEMLEVFGDSDPTEHAAEAEQRWGETGAFRESQRRASSYDKQQWLDIQAEARDIERRLAAAQAAGASPSDLDAMEAAEAHRRHVSTWFYDCPPAVHRALGEMYVSDERFTAHYDRIAPGLAAFVRDAIAANADRSGPA
jgi:MerR family transcriptional regulator, thiopeptide resistance regulator